MFFWLCAAFLTIAACLAVLLPFLRRDNPAADPLAHDMEVYRDQLSELERDAARGLIAPAEAEQARAEIGRRILQLDRSEGARPRQSFDRAAKLVASAAVLAVPVLSWGIYVAVGSPAEPDRRLAVRLSGNPEQNSVAELVARAEQHLTQNPDDGRGWDVLAPIYLRSGRAQDAVTAFTNSIRINGATAAREAGLGEARVAVSGGIVTADAQSAFSRALAIDPADGKARYYMALGHSQEGDGEKSMALWQAMTMDLPEGSPWRRAAADALRQTAAAVTERGPTDGDIAAAAQMSAQERMVMVEGMVAQLDGRLRENPDDLDGWRRLMRSYQALGRPEEARKALERGAGQVGVDTPLGRDLLALAASLGEGGVQPQ